MFTVYLKEFSKKQFRVFNKFTVYLKDTILERVFKILERVLQYSILERVFNMFTVYLKKSFQNVYSILERVFKIFTVYLKEFSKCLQYT